jgi:choline dehydrogenase-like flavoprotein
MPHALTELKLDAVTRPATEPAHEIQADVCVVGAGIAGLSAAIESARLGRDVVLVDSLPVIGGQMVHALIGLFCGVFGNAPRYEQLTHGIFDELHDRPEGYVWEMFEADHVHYVPLRSMTPPGVHNVLAAGRCVDGDAAALSSVRVMGPCAAMGAAAAHALDLAGGGSTHDIDLDRLRRRVAANVG